MRFSIENPVCQQAIHNSASHVRAVCRNGPGKHGPRDGGDFAVPPVPDAAPFGGGGAPNGREREENACITWKPNRF